MTTTTPDPTMAANAADVAAQAERDAVAKALRRHADRKRADHQDVVKARAEAVTMALGYTELNAMEEPVLVAEGLYSYEDVLGWLAHAVELGAALPRIGGDTVERIYRAELIPNAIFREKLAARIRDGRETMKGFAQKVDFVNGDERNLQRALGMDTSPGRAEYPPTLRLFISYDQALAFAKALELHPTDCGV